MTCETQIEVDGVKFDLNVIAERIEALETKVGHLKEDNNALQSKVAGLEQTLRTHVLLHPSTCYCPDAPQA